MVFVKIQLEYLHETHARLHTEGNTPAKSRRITVEINDRFLPPSRSLPPIGLLAREKNHRFIYVIEPSLSPSPLPLDLAMTVDNKWIR